MLGELHILPTKNTPGFEFSPDGMLKIRGRGLFQNEPDFVGQITNWIDEYLINPAEKTYVIIAFEYLNSFSTFILVSLLRKLLNVILQSEKLIIQWYYEEDDEDIIERGEYISESFNIPITFVITDSITGN